MLLFPAVIQTAGFLCNRKLRCNFLLHKNAPRGYADRGDGVNCCAIPRSR